MDQERSSADDLCFLERYNTFSPAPLSQWRAHAWDRATASARSKRGKEADFTILESDPYKLSPDAIADIKVSETYVAGQRKFAA